MEKETDNLICNKHKYYCDLCKYGAKTNGDWLKHTKSEKHKRGGLKIKICPLCNHECFNHWNLKQHYVMNHSTKEEREKQKYYCKICDTVFFCKLYMETHNKSKKHTNTIKCLDEIENMKIIKENKDANTVKELLSIKNVSN